MSEDIANNFELKPVIVGAIISIICIMIGTSIGIGFIGIFGLIVGSAVSGFISENSTKYALIYGAIIGIVSSFLLFTVFTIPIFVILGVFGGFVGKILQSNF